jgi:formylmethanofuran dehydrogenase subunit C
MPLHLRWLDKTTLPVEGTPLSPEALGGLPAAEVARRPIPVGNGTAEVGDLFRVGEPADAPDADSITVEGDLRHVRGLGRGMARGTLVVRGDVGAHLGAGMSGGVITVHGDAADWAGAEMRGGLLRVHGRAGRFLGASYPGSRLGMREGVILVDGSVGEEAGRRMRRGLIAVRGAVGEGFGAGLVAGSLFAFGPAGRYPGAGMKRGTVVLLGGGAGLSPSFAPAGRYRFPFLSIYFRQLAAWGFPVPGEVFSAEFDRYNGDLVEGGQGEVLAPAGAFGG